MRSTPAPAPSCWAHSPSDAVWCLSQVHGVLFWARVLTRVVTLDYGCGGLFCSIVFTAAAPMRSLGGSPYAGVE